MIIPCEMLRMNILTRQEAYRGSWIALRAGQLLYASPSFDDVIAHVGEVRGRGVLLTKIPA